MELPRRLQKIWKRASSPRGEGLPVNSTNFRDPLALDDIDKGRISSRKEQIRKIRREEILQRKKQIYSDLWGVSVELEQLWDIAVRNSNTQVTGTGKGENLCRNDRKQFRRIMKRIEQHSSFYSHEALRIRCIALGLPVPSRLTGHAITIM